MNSKATSTQEYLEMNLQWKLQLQTIVELLETLPLEEHIKWNAPCYTYNGKNIVGLVAFKNHCAVWFHQGALLDDSHQILVNAQPGKTKLLRQIRFRESDMPNISILKGYIEQAIDLVGS